LHHVNVLNEYRVQVNIKFIKILSRHVTQALQHSCKQKIDHKPQNFVTDALLQSGIVTIDEVPHAKQASDLRIRHHVG